ncbi:signal peptidase I [Candidatus Kuenenbacteria bacterium CG11_big_fil_rev_8_21_14_0_20_37_9]|nr:MAG: signal peptidase I [Candidatus Kuenenbacteria bacterium CG11_big_fil_rev_8_21_14_0_20_37_9]
MRIIKIIYCFFTAGVIVLAGLFIFSTVPIFGCKILVVESGSMQPAIKTGSLVVVMAAREYAVNDIITFGAIGMEKIPITHRIVDVRDRGLESLYVTKGDANNAPDKKEVRLEEIIGRVLFTMPYIGYAIGFGKKPIGFILIIGLPAFAIILDEARKIAEEIKKRNEQNKHS